MSREYRLVKPDGEPVGWFKVEGPTEALPDGWREMVAAADTSATFTFETPRGLYLGVTVKAVH